MQSVAAATTAKLFELQPTRRVLLVFGRYIIAFFTLGALQNYVISRHNFLPYKFLCCQLPVMRCIDKPATDH
jgi:hypothetical protein